VRASRPNSELRTELVTCPDCSTNNSISFTVRRELPVERGKRIDPSEPKFAYAGAGSRTPRPQKPIEPMGPSKFRCETCNGKGYIEVGNEPPMIRSKRVAKRARRARQLEKYRPVNPVYLPLPEHLQ
jgi:hypothetical protein